MINPGILYRVTGRYMDGQKVIAYHLVGEDGSQSKETKERVIWLIGKGVISNMRVQIGGNKEVIVRGKGINLNTLPVYDQGKQKFRANNASQEVANTKVNTRKSTVLEANPMGQYKILKRIMYKNKCLGYEIQDCSGAVYRKKRDDVIKLAVQKLLSNAIAQKYRKPNETTARIILRGVGCDLSKLPILIVSDSGKIVDPTSNNELSVRSAFMKHSGLLHDNINGNKIRFKAGDFIICQPNGHIIIESRTNVSNKYTQDKKDTTAVCDNYLDVAKNYKVEILGNKPFDLTPSMIKTWVILKPNKHVQNR